MGPFAPVTHQSSGPAFRNMLQSRVDKQSDLSHQDLCFWGLIFPPSNTVGCSDFSSKDSVQHEVHCPENTCGSDGEFSLLIISFSLILA